MCGRYSLCMPQIKGIDDRFSFRGDDLVYTPRYNIAPTQEVLTVVGNRQRHGVFMRWGLIPISAKDTKMAYKMINARDDKVAGSSIFNPLLLGSEKSGAPPKRCLIGADGFYGWRKEGKDRVPMRITLKGGDPFAFAGLWSSWGNRETGETIQSCTIITTGPNSRIAPIHDRMPVILPFEAEEMWLDSNIRNQETALSFLKPFPGDSMDAFQVSPLVNSVKNESPECAVPVG